MCLIEVMLITTGAMILKSCKTCFPYICKCIFKKENKNKFK